MKLDVLNVLALLLALACAMVGGGHNTFSSAGPAQVSVHAPLFEPERLPDGTPAIRDAQGALIPLRDYRRIASGTLIADRVLADLCEPDRIVAFTRYAAKTPSGHRYAGKPTLGARDDLERVLALGPELLFVNDLVDANYVARLREHGVQVFDLGPMRGVETLLPNIRAIGSLIGAGERAQRYAERLRERLRRVALEVAHLPHPRALYLSIYGDKLFAAAAGTSYHDVIVYAGLTDAAAQAGLAGWPELSAEQVLAIRPEVVITRAGMGTVLCRHPGLDQLPSCGATGRLVELDGALLDDPGPGLLEATEALYAAYWIR